jgi:hypothetical protein
MDKSNRIKYSCCLIPLHFLHGPSTHCDSCPTFSGEGPVVFVFVVEQHLSHGHGFTDCLGDVPVLVFDQVNQEFRRLLRTDAGDLFDFGQQQVFVRFFCGVQTDTVRPGGIHFPVSRGTNDNEKLARNSRLYLWCARHGV